MDNVLSIEQMENLSNLGLSLDSLPASLWWARRTIYYNGEPAITGKWYLRTEKKKPVTSGNYLHEYDYIPTLTFSDILSILPMSITTEKGKCSLLLRKEEIGGTMTWRLDYFPVVSPDGFGALNANYDMDPLYAAYHALSMYLAGNKRRKITEGAPRPRLSLGVEEMKTLINDGLGIDDKDVSLWWMRQLTDFSRNPVEDEWTLMTFNNPIVQNFETYEIIPALTLSGILSLLPGNFLDISKGSVYRPYMEKSSLGGKTKYRAGYFKYKGGLLMFPTRYYDDPLDAGYELLHTFAEGKLKG